MLEESTRRILTGKTTFLACMADQRFSFCVYIPAAHSFEEDAERLPVLVAVHGTRRNVGGLVDGLEKWSETRGIAILCPLFPAGILDPGDIHSFKNVRYGDIRFDQVLLAMLEQAAGIWRIKIERVWMHGFSAGGQFAHRFLYLHPTRLLGVSIGAPGSITRPSLRDVAWPKGTKNFFEVFGMEVEWEAVKRVPVQVVVGERHTSLGMLSGEGGTRRDRANTLHDELASMGCSTVLSIVPGIGHDGIKALVAVEAWIDDHVQMG